jgi:hypothetical protein
MIFANDAVEIAHSAMHAEDPNLVGAFTTLIRFMAENPDVARALQGKNKPAVGTADYIRIQAQKFASSRKEKKPAPPKTVPDEMVSSVLVSYFGIRQSDVGRIKEEHRLSMAAENFVGDLLELYLASVLEPRGWVWCSASTIKAVDFIKSPNALGSAWRLLQVKNRDNSENSSSSAIRNGTPIEKWFRTFSRRAGSNWDRFPDPALRQYLSEDGFKKFAHDYLESLARTDRGLVVDVATPSQLRSGTPLQSRR